MPDKKRTPTGALGGLLGLVGLSAVAGVLIAATVTPAIAVSGAAASSAIKIFDNMPSYLKIDKLMQPTTIVMGDVRTSFYDQNRAPVNFDQVAPVMYDAILSSEDPRYYQHGGVDLIGTTRALLSNAQGGETQGGSSISQQYVKNVLIQQCEKNAAAEYADDGSTIQTRDEALQSCWLEATVAEDVEGYERKLQEMRYAIQLEKEYSKNEILLGYLNIANFGRTTYGIEAAAKYYFNVPAAQLSLAQAATLAGIVQNPNTYKIDDPASTSNGAPNGVVDPVAGYSLAGLDTMMNAGTITQEQYTAAADGYTVTKSRQLYVLSRLLDDGKITQEQYNAAAIEPITPAITQPQTGCQSTGAYAYFCAYVVSVIEKDSSFGETPEDRARALRQDGLTIYTTLDPRIQDAANAAMAEYAPQSMPNTKYGASIVNLESKTGRVLAIAQNTTYVPGASDDPNTTSIVYAGDPVFGASGGFEAGSTFKLFTLIDWLEKGHSVNESVNGSTAAIRRFTNGCIGDITNNTWKANNFDRGGGYTGTPMRFTRDSLNSGYVAMAAQLDLCDIGKVASKMGVMSSEKGGSALDGTAAPIETNYPAQVIGPAAVSPMAMASAYATVANGGNYCKPQVIDRITDSDGADLPDLIPVRGCAPVVTPEVSATAASALAGVMNGGTGARANPGDGVPVIGKTGSHELRQTWMIESSTNVTTAVWAGNADGNLDPFKNRYRGRTLSDIRYPLARDVQAVANEFYGGDRFPDPDPTLIRQIFKDVPNVVGQNIAQAQATLENAGFEVQVGSPVDSELPTDVVAAQNPAGRASAGANITISPSNGQAASIPNVEGTDVVQASAALQAAGFTQLSGSCTVDPNAPNNGLVTGTNPGAGTAVGRNTAIAISYTAKAC